MRVSGSFNNLNNIQNLFNTFAQGQVSIIANKLSNSKFLFPENNAPGKGSVSSDTVSYISDIKSASKDLSGAMNALSGSAFNQRGLVSSDTDVMSVKYSGTSGGMSSVSDMKVRIDQIAKGQVNEGDSLKAADKYTGNTGVNRFSVDTGGKTTQLSVSISATDTNKDVQQKMATAINNAGLGLKATVETDSKTKESVLKIESNQTGSDAKNAFSLKDVTGNAVAATGANNMTSAAQDAIYSVNGGPAQTSKTNTVDLGKGVTATFKSESVGNVSITQGKDTSSAINAVNDMVSSYNKLFGAAAGNTSDPKAQNLASRLLNVSSVYSKSLSDVGIGFDTSGKMTIDSEKLNKAAEDGSLQKLFTQDSGRNYGITSQFGRLADNVSNNTASFVTSSVFGQASDIFGYSGLGNMTQLRAQSIGSLFDYSF